MTLTLAPLAGLAAPLLVLVVVAAAAAATVVVVVVVQQLVVKQSSCAAVSRYASLFFRSSTQAVVQGHGHGHEPRAVEVPSLTPVPAQEALSGRRGEWQ